MAKTKTTNKMKEALTKMSVAGNRHAMTRKEALEFGIDEMTHNLWGIKVEQVRVALVPYIQEKTKDNPDQKKLGELYSKIFPVWKQVTHFADALLINDSEHDVNSLIGFGETWTVIPEKGSVWTVESGLLFRKAVEAYLGIKIRKNPVLTGEEKDVVEAYIKAVKKIKTNNEKLHGIKSEKEDIPGILDKIAGIEADIANIEKRIKETTTFMKQAEGDALNFFEAMIKGFEEDRKKLNSDLTDKKNTKTQLEEQIKKAETVKEANKDKYEEITGRIK